MVLAVLRGEVAEDSLLPLFEGASLSSVNLTEILSKLDEISPGPYPKAKRLLSLFAGVKPFTERQARMAAELRARTRHAGLSLGDRACLALAMELEADVYTADRAWSTLDLPCRIHLIR